MLPPEYIDRFWAKVDKADGCWLWSGWGHSRGYGLFGYRQDDARQLAYAHRVAYELAVGPIPEGLQIDHLCRNKRCVNPDHLEAVTGAENHRRWADQITHCKHGHALEGENVYIRKDTGTRQCRACALTRKRANAEQSAAYSREYRRRMREAA